MSTQASMEDFFVGTATVGERGQVVIPADVRKKFDIHTGDKLIIMGHPSREGIVLLKTEAMREFLNHMAAGLSLVDAEQSTEL